MPEKAWAYYSSASDDEITNRENHAAFRRCVLRRQPWTRRIMYLWLAPQDLVPTTDYARRDNCRLVNNDSGSSVKNANIHSQRVQYPCELLVTLYTVRDGSWKAWTS
jgi:hypothetical protein